MPNEQLIDTVILPAAGEQVENLSKLLADLDIQMASNIKNANLLNATTSNSKSFAEYSKNATQTALALEKIQQAQNKTAQTTLALDTAQKKSAADQQAREDKAMAQLVKKQQAQAAADAKEIAAAESKAAKLQAIADKQAKIANQDGGIFIGNTPIADVQSAPDSNLPPLTPEEADRRKAAYYANKPADVSQQKEATVATEEETAALKAQQEALAQLSPEYIANIETLNALKVEQLENASALKAVNINTEQGIELQTLLVANQLRLKVEVAEVTAALSRQTKEQIAAEGSVKELTAALELLRNEYFELSAAERESTEGQKMLKSIQALDVEVKALRVTAGDTSKEVGAYEKAIAKATSGTQLAATAVNVATRSLVRMFVQFALIGVIIDAVTWIYNYVKALDIFNDVASVSATKQQALTEAFTSSEYQKGVENVEKLAANLDLAKTGIVDSDKAINEYNDTIGKTFGYVNNLNDAQKGFVANSDKYIQTLYLEAAAQAALANSSKFAAETLAKNVELQAEKSNIDYDTKGAQQMGFSKAVIDNQKQQSKDLQSEIDNNNKRVIQSYKNTVAAIKDLYKSADAQNPGSSAGPDAVNDMRTKIANEQLEHEKIIAQNKISNDKLSYKERLQAVQDFYNASAKIEENNKNAELVKLPANDARREDIEKDAANKLLTLQEQTASQRRQLLDKQYKQDQEIIKNNIEKQRDLFKAVLDDPNQSYDAKLIALEYYNKKSQDLIKANYDEQLKEAGKNRESVRLAEQNRDKATLQLTNETASEKLKIVKENLNKILEQTKESEQEQLDALENGKNLALQALTKVRDDKVTELTNQRAADKISEQKYQEELLAIDDEFAVKRIELEIATQQGLIAAKEGKRDVSLIRAKQDGASPAELSKIQSDGDKDVQGAKNTLAGLESQLSAAKNKQTIDGQKGADKDDNAKEKGELFALEQTAKAVDELDKLRQKAYEAEISRLEKLKEQIDENAANEKLQVQNSIASSATKARQIAVIDAQSASAKKAIDEQEAKIKQKQAIADKEASVAKIILSTAEAAIKAPAELGPILGLLAVPVVLALGAVELAAALAAPIPKFAKGGVTQGGLALWGEAGMESARLPSGEVRLSNGAEIANFPRGTVITPHMELMQQIKPAKIDYAGGEAIGWKEVVKAINGQKRDRQTNRVNVNMDLGFELYKQQYLKR